MRRSACGPLPARAALSWKGAEATAQRCGGSLTRRQRRLGASSQSAERAARRECADVAARTGHLDREQARVGAEACQHHAGRGRHGRWGAGWDGLGRGGVGLGVGGLGWGGVR